MLCAFLACAGIEQAEVLASCGDYVVIGSRSNHGHGSMDHVFRHSGTEMPGQSAGDVPADLAAHGEHAPSPSRQREGCPGGFCSDPSSLPTAPPRTLSVESERWVTLRTRTAEIPPVSSEFRRESPAIQPVVQGLSIFRPPR